MIRFLATAALGVLCAGAAWADWTHEQGGGRALAVAQAGGFTFQMSCEAGRAGQIYWYIRGPAGGDPDLGRAETAMLWIELPDARTDRWPIDLEGTARGTGGFHPVSDFNMEFFRNAVSMEVELYPQRRTLAVLPMGGSGAARLAFLEQCGI